MVCANAVLTLPHQARNRPRLLHRDPPPEGSKLLPADRQLDRHARKVWFSETSSFRSFRSVKLPKTPFFARPTREPERGGLLCRLAPSRCVRLEKSSNPHRTRTRAEKASAKFASRTPQNGG